jgi:hypothetical protein
MLKSELLPSTQNLRAARTCAGVLCAAIALLLPAVGQNDYFTLQMNPFPSPAAIDPGGTAAAGITVSPIGTFSETVNLSCQVTSATTGQVVTTPVCEVSTQSVTPPATATATITTVGATPPGLYSVAVTGTSNGTSASAQQNLTILAVTPQFTITVTQQVEPSSVHAGSGGQGVITINPIYGYVIPPGGVTLSCASITPLVTLPPVCSFNKNPIVGVYSSTLTINTTGPLPRAVVASARPWYALWLPLPVMALAGVGAVRGKRARRAWCVLALLVLAGATLLMPACGNTTTTTTTNPNGLITPKNTYTFTLMGVDADGVVSSNTGTSAPTVTLIVN